MVKKTSYEVINKQTFLSLQYYKTENVSTTVFSTKSMEKVENLETTNDSNDNNGRTIKHSFKRFPDFGPLDINDWQEFLLKSKKMFDENWNKPLDHEEKLSDFKIVKLLGNGTYGDVVLIKRKKKMDFFAMKAIAKERLIQTERLDLAKNEKIILKSINFPLTVYLIYFFKDNSYIYMVLPFIPGGELFSLLEKVGKFEESEASFYASQMILALEYLHYLDLVYRDLKPENILIDHTGYLKLTDFGFCKRLTNHRTYTFCGTPEYIAPEVILSKGYGKSVDWWSIGVLMYELVAGNTPFVADDPMVLYEKIVSAKYKMPSQFSPALKDLVKNILQIDTSKRYGNMRNGVNDIKKHKWFKQMDWMGVLNRRASAKYKPAYKYPGDTKHFQEFGFIPLRVAKENKYAEEFADF